MKQLWGRRRENATVPLSDEIAVATLELKVTDTRATHKTAYGTSLAFSPRLQLLGYTFLVGALAVGGWLMMKTVRAMPAAVISINPQTMSNATPLTTGQINELQQVVGTKADTNIYQVNLQDYKNKIEAISWVNQVDIKRDWEKGLVVTVIPRQPVAKYGSEKLIDAQGQVFTPPDPEVLNQPWMQLQGDVATSATVMQQSKQVTEWFRPLGLKLEEVILTPRMTWLFRFDNGLRVLVDKDNTSEKLYKLSLLLQNQLKPKLAQIESLDLRYKNGMAVTWRAAINAEIPDTAQATQTLTNTKTTAAKKKQGA